MKALSRQHPLGNCAAGGFVPRHFYVQPCRDGGCRGAGDGLSLAGRAAISAVPMVHGRAVSGQRCVGAVRAGQPQRQGVFAERTRKLLVPSTLGLLVLGWAQGYFNVAFSHVFENILSGVPAPVLYLIMTVSGIGVLWTCHVLWVCALVLLAVRRIECGRLLAKCASLPCWAVAAWVMAAWVSAQVLNPPIIQVYRFGIYIFSYLAGYYVFFATAGHGHAGPPGTDFVRRGCRAGAGLPLAQLGQELRRRSQREQPLAIAYGWAACLAIFGGMKRWGDRTSLWPRSWRGTVLGCTSATIWRFVGGGLWAGVLPALARRGGIPAVRRSCLRRRAGAVCRAAPCAGGAVLCFRH